jgi:hypothetical protein
MRALALILALEALTSCVLTPADDAVQALEPEPCEEQEHAQALAAWPAGTRLAMDPPADYPCKRELQWARDRWAKAGIVFHEPTEPGVTKVPIAFDAKLWRAGNTNVAWMRPSGVIASASVRTNVCNWSVIAHEMGHVLGFAVHATRPGALMNGALSGDDVSEQELEALRRRQEDPGAEACSLGEGSE